VNERRLSDTKLKGSEYNYHGVRTTEPTLPVRSAGDMSDLDKGEAILAHYGREERVGVLCAKTCFLDVKGFSAISFGFSNHDHLTSD